MSHREYGYLLEVINSNVRRYHRLYPNVAQELHNNQDPDCPRGLVLHLISPDASPRVEAFTNLRAKCKAAIATSQGTLWPIQARFSAGRTLAIFNIVARLDEST